MRELRVALENTMQAQLLLLSGWGLTYDQGGQSSILS